MESDSMELLVMAVLMTASQGQNPLRTEQPQWLHCHLGFTSTLPGHPIGTVGIWIVVQHSPTMHFIINMIKHCVCPSNQCNQMREKLGVMLKEQ